MIVGGLGVLGDAHSSRPRTDPGRKSGVGRHWNLGSWAFPGLARGVSRTVVVVRERDDRSRGRGHDTGRLFAFRRLAVQVGHRAGVARGQPAIELGGVGVRLERGDSHCVEAHLERATLQLDGSARRLCVTLLLDAFVFHTCIVSRRHRAKLITSSTGGTACSSPYAVSIRQRVYSRGGSGRNGGRRYQSRARKLHARRSRSRASRGLTAARSTRRASRADHVTGDTMRLNLLRDVSTVLFLLYIDRL